jgi:hypothetical protein
MNTDLYFTEIQIGLEGIFRTHTDISRIYLSIGGKYNESNEASNSDLQMVPMFMREEHPGRTLILVWDLFNNPDNLAANRNILDQLQRQHRHISYILINNRCSAESLIAFIPYLIDLAARSQINSQNFIICNYVRFKYNPNPVEREAETCIPQTVMQLLNWPEHTLYRDIFYQWFGYHPTLYNYIYNHSNTEHMLYAENIIAVVSKLVSKYCLRESPDTTVIQDRKVIQMLSNVYDLRQYATHGLLLPADTLLTTLSESNYILRHNC